MQAQNNHVGGDLQYEYLGNYNYELVLNLYWGCSKRINGWQPSVEITDIADSTSFFINLDSVSSVVAIDEFASSPCVSPENEVCFKKISFKGIATLAPSGLGYQMEFTSASRNIQIDNLENVGNYGSIYSCQVPDSNTFNNSVVFASLPPAYMCLGEDFTYNLSLIDADGDSVVYFLCDPKVRLLADPDSIVRTPWSLGYDSLNPFPSTDGFKLDTSTSILWGKPNLAGYYVYATCYNEYRGDTLINQGQRDIIVEIGACVSPVYLAESKMDVSASVMCLDGNVFDFSTTDFIEPDLGVVEFEWDFGDGNTANIKDPSYSFNDTGAFTVRLKLFTHGHPDCNDYEELLFDTIISIVESPIANFTVNQDTQCFASQEFLFDLGVPNMAGVTYEWDFGANASTQNYSGTNPPSISFSSGGPQMVILKAEHKVCFGSDTIYPTVFTPPEPKFVSVQAGCGPLEVNFSNTTNPWMDEVDWVWDFGDGISSIDENPVHTYVDSGSFSVTLLAVAYGLCPGVYDSTFINHIEVYPLPNAQFSVGQNGGPFGKTVELVDESLNGNVLYYNYGDGTPLTTLESHQYQNSGDYVIKQVMLNKYDCFDTASVAYFVKPFMTIFMPNSFTPNGDRVNDVYLQKGFDLGYNVDTYELQVYTRWGEMIYSTFDIDEGWDGNTNTGKKARLGVYVYKTIVKDFYGIVHEYTGTINLMR